LVEVLRLDAGADTHATLDAAQMSHLGESGATVYCRIEALHNGDTIARSRPLPIRLP
jgi:hypothetical protein